MPRAAGDDPERTKVKQLRGLDALGLLRVDSDLHLANMAEDAFPTGGQAVGWPFTLADLRAAPDGPDEAVEPVTAGLLEMRAQTAALSDLYLFWLALDGVAPGRKVRISWVSDSAGERRRLSPIVSLLTVPDSTEAVKKVAGGIQVRPGPNPAEQAADRGRPQSISPKRMTTCSWRRPTRSTCARLQHCPCVSPPLRAPVGMGPTASFGPSYLQTMLYGNVVGALRAGGASAQRRPGDRR